MPKCVDMAIGSDLYLTALQIFLVSPIFFVHIQYKTLAKVPLFTKKIATIPWSQGFALFTNKCAVCQLLPALRQFIFKCYWETLP